MVIVMVKASEGRARWPLGHYLPRRSLLVTQDFQWKGHLTCKLAGWLPTKWPSSGGIAPTFEIGSSIVDGVVTFSCWCCCYSAGAGENSLMDEESSWRLNQSARITFSRLEARWYLNWRWLFNLFKLATAVQLPGWRVDLLFFLQLIISTRIITKHQNDKSDPSRSSSAIIAELAEPASHAATVEFPGIVDWCGCSIWQTYQNNFLNKTAPSSTPRGR